MSETLLPVRPIPLKDEAQLRKAQSLKIESYYRFRGFQVDVRNRIVTCNGAVVEVGSRAFDLLVVLLEMRGTIVNKQQIMQVVWPSTIVDDGNLRFQMACLRRVLGPDRDIIKTIPGRGYLFVADVISGAERESPTSATDGHQSKPLPAGADRPALVALVDDDANIREALDGFLRSSGFLVEAYPSPQEFLCAGASIADCLVLDVWMQGRSGLEFQADLNAAGVDVPIIFISGHADIQMSVRAMKAGAVEFLTKPVRHQELLDAVQAAVVARREQAKPA